MESLVERRLKEIEGDLQDIQHECNIALDHLYNWKPEEAKKAILRIKANIQSLRKPAIVPHDGRTA